MLDNLVEEHEGRELLTKDELEASEFGVEVRAGNILGLYAFSDRLNATNFLLDATFEVAEEVETLGSAFVFAEPAAETKVEQALDPVPQKSMLDHVKGFLNRLGF